MPALLLAAPVRVVSLKTPFGWLAASFREQRCREIRFGYEAEHEALSALAEPCEELLSPRRAGREEGIGPFVEELRRYCRGDRSVDFQTLELDLECLTPFQARIVECCRGIPFGDTLAYGELAAAAGRPRAARAVGNTMARNRFPLVVPCHRVVGAGGRLTGFSAPGGLTTKQRLLAHEAK